MLGRERKSVVVVPKSALGLALYCPCGLQPLPRYLVAEACDLKLNFSLPGCLGRIGREVSADMVAHMEAVRSHLCRPGLWALVTYHCLIF